MSKKMNKKKKTLGKIITLKKSLTYGKKPFDYFCELWNSYKISSNSSV